MDKVAEDEDGEDIEGIEDYVEEQGGVASEKKESKDKKIYFRKNLKLNLRETSQTQNRKESKQISLPRISGNNYKICVT